MTEEVKEVEAVKEVKKRVAKVKILSGTVVIKAEMPREFTDKQGIKRKAMKEIEIAANAFNTIQWYGVKITGGDKYYVDKALALGAEKK